MVPDRVPVPDRVNVVQLFPILLFRWHNCLITFLLVDPQIVEVTTSSKTAHEERFVTQHHRRIFSAPAARLWRPVLRLQLTLTASPAGNCDSLPPPSISYFPLAEQVVFTRFPFG